jgi:DNA-binding transcriptional LysR family regulator
MATVAEAISLTPSAVSQQLAALERAAGVRLLEPAGRRVRLTPAGQLLAERAEPILGALREAADEVAALGADATGELRVASFPSVAAALCPTVIRSFAERHPSHRIRLSEMDTAASVSAVVAGDVDIAIIDEPYLPLAEQQPAVAYRELLADPLYCVLPAGHRLAARRSVGLRQLAGEAWVLDDPGCPFHKLTIDLCGKAGFEPAAIANTESVSVSAALVRAGAVAILPGLAVAGLTDLTVRALRPRVTRRLYALHRRGAGRRHSVATALDLLHATATTVATTVARRSTPDAPHPGRAGPATPSGR